MKTSIKDRIVSSVLIAIVALLGGFVMASQCGCDGVFGLEHVDDPTATDASELGGSDGSITGDGHQNDSHVTPDARPPDAAIPVTLTETANDTVASGTGVSCSAPGGTTTVANTWYRAFEPSTLGVADELYITAVTFGVDKANAATDVSIQVGLYTGQYGGQLLTLADFTGIATASVNVPNSDTPQSVTAPISAMIPAGGIFLVMIAAPTLQGVGYYHTGFTTSAETEPGYFSSPGSATACNAVNPPEATSSLGHVILDVEGTH